MFFTLVAEALEATKDKGHFFALCTSKDKGQKTKDMFFTLVAEALEATKDKGHFFAL
jgi:hypothetical protein